MFSSIEFAAKISCFHSFDDKSASKFYKFSLDLLVEVGGYAEKMGEMIQFDLRFFLSKRWKNHPPTHDV